MEEAKVKVQGTVAIESNGLPCRVVKYSHGSHAKTEHLAAKRLKYNREKAKPDKPVSPLREPDYSDKTSAILKSIDLDESNGLAKFVIKAPLSSKIDRLVLQDDERRSALSTNAKSAAAVVPQAVQVQINMAIGAALHHVNESKT